MPEIINLYDFPTGQAVDPQRLNDNFDIVASAFNSSAVRTDETAAQALAGALHIRGGPLFDVKAFGAKGDVRLTTGSITEGSTTVTVPSSGTFSQNDLGKALSVRGAGVLESSTDPGREARRHDLYARIAAVAADGASATLSVAATVTVSNSVVKWGTDDTAAFQAAAAAVQAAGGGTLYVPHGDAGGYWVYSFVHSETLPAAPLIDFVGLVGASVECDALLHTDRAFTYETGYDLVRLTNCIRSRVRISRVVGELHPRVETIRGPFVVMLHGRCIDTEVDVSAEGVYTVLTANTPDADRFDDSKRSTGIRFHVRANNCGYGVALQFSGDSASGTVEATNCYRTLIPYGVKDLRCVARITNPAADAIQLTGYSGASLEAVDLTVLHTGSSVEWGPGLGLVAIKAISNAPCTWKNIRIHYHVNASLGTEGAVLRFVKHDDTGAYDAQPRGHVVDGLTVTGLISGPFATSPLQWYVNQPGDIGGWSNETFRCFDFDGLAISGTGHALQMNLRPLEDVARIGIVTDQPMVVEAADKADIRTLQGSVRSVRAETVYAGALNGDLSALFIARHVGSGARYRLRYYVVLDPADISPATRKEVTGCVTWTGWVSADGINAGYLLPVIHEYPERRLNLSGSSVFYFSGNGGGQVWYRHPDMGSAAVRGWFSLEVESTEIISGIHVL